MGSDALTLPRAALDITDKAAVRDFMCRERPRAVINCAAWTAVDAAESQVEACFAVNARAVESLAEACDEVGSLLVQVSTDYVFGADHARATPYREDDPTGPLTTYGNSKLAGEVAARQCDRHIIARTCGLYSAGPHGPVRGRNFLDTMLVLAASRPEVSVVTDQICTPSYVPHVARGILALLEAGATGTFHVTNGGWTSWHGLASELFKQAGLSTAVRPITSRDYPSAIERPGYSVLATEKLVKTADTRLSDWQEGVADYLRSR